jgi:hypothetical protein
MILLLFVVLGCQTPRYTFRLAQTYVDDPSMYKTLPVEEVKFEIAYAGPQQVDGKKALQFDMQIENTGSKAISIGPKSYALLDDDNRRFSQEWSGGDSGTLLLIPRSSLKFSLFFIVPGDYNFAYAGSLRLLWNYQCDANVYRRVSKFIKYEVEYRYREAYYAYWGWPHGYYPCYHDRRVWYGTSIGFRWGCW